MELSSPQRTYNYKMGGEISDLAPIPLKTRRVLVELGFSIKMAIFIIFQECLFMVENLKNT